MGDSGGGGDEDRGNGAGIGDALKENCAVSVVIWGQELGADSGHTKITIGIPSYSN